jgi:hypothetical protein
MRDRGESLQAIADALNGEQVPPPRGRPKWRPASVRATLERDRPGADRNVVELRPPGRFQRGGPESPAEAEPRPPDGDPKTRQGRRKS